MSRARILAMGFLAIAVLTAPRVEAQTFVDWTSVDLVGNTANGNIGPIDVTFSGFDVNFFQANSTAFNDATFCPPLASCDLVEFVANTGNPAYTIQFGRAVHNPLLHFRSLGSTLTFAGPSITKVCGQSGFTVVGNQVIAANCFGGGPPPVDSDNNGTIRVNGWVTHVDFTAHFDTAKPGCSGAGTVDGIDLQIGADASEVPATSRPGLLVLTLLTGLMGAGILMRSRRRAAAA